MLNAAEEPRRKMTEGEETFGHHSQSVIGNPNGDNPTLRPDRFMNPFKTVAIFFTSSPSYINSNNRILFLDLSLGSFIYFLNSDLLILRISFSYKYPKISHNLNS